jgi:spore maturation protein CgeB
VKKILCLLHKHQFGSLEYPISVEYKLIYKTLKKINKNTFFFDTHKEKSIHLSNLKILECVKRIKPELIFCHQSFYEIYSETFCAIRSICSPLIINWCSDDSWRYEQHSSLIAKSFDYQITTYKSAHNNNIKNKINSILSHWGCDENFFIKPNKKSSYLYDVCFIGNSYLGRKKIIQELKDLGISVECFGKGWGKIIDDKQLPLVMNNSKININFSKSRGNQLQTKARIFEIIGAGGFCISEKSNEIKDFFRENREIVIFNNLAELRDKIKYYLKNEIKRKSICNKGYLRCFKNYSYKKIIQNILKLTSKKKPKKPNINFSYKDLNFLTRSPSLILRLYKSISIIIFMTFFSKEKAVKFSRRLLFEIEWRIRGDKTYSSKGWCSNLFNYL